MLRLIEVVETGRHRQSTDDEKLKIVLESLPAPRAVSSTARRYGISRSLLLTWQRSFGPRASCDDELRAGFVPAMVMPDPGNKQLWRRQRAEA
ncbi:transposase [Bradyrhizobium sp. 157]|uniref:transposase n=1 Tax=Bradyrhizobium sp. 157 TaxID=2782631 RepID=UPI001FFAA396|nr:transposase [Bradyrhizobium sp. 157]